MKTMQDVELAFANCGRDKEALKKFADDLYVLMYTKPCLFKLGKIDADNRSEFLISLYDTLKKIPLYYSQDKGEFQKYIQLIVLRNYRSWLRRKIKKIATEKSVMYCLEQEYQEMVISEPEQNYGELDMAMSHAEICERGLKKLLQGERLLMLAFKSSYFLNESLIKKLSFFTGHSEKELWDIKSKIDAANERRITNYHRHFMGINACYVLKNRYLWELEHLNPESMHYSRMLYSYCMQKGLWNRKVRKISGPPASVPNKVLASVFKVKKCKVDTALLYTRRKVQEGEEGME